MRFIDALEVKTHLSLLLDEAEKGEVITITRRGRPVARLMRPVPVDRAQAEQAVRNIRALRREIGWSGTVEEILELREAGHHRTAESDSGRICR